MSQVNHVQINLLIDRANQLLNRIEAIIPKTASVVDLSKASAFRWRNTGHQSFLEPVKNLSCVSLTDLLFIDEQKRKIEQNTRQFIAGYPANNALLWGPRGTGKSSLVKAIFNEFKEKNLKIIEVNKQQLQDIQDIVCELDTASGYFIIYCDDLSFGKNEDGYKSLKIILDGTISQIPDNILIYATSNRRHLLPEFMYDNLDSRFENKELHMSEATEEKISLSERFGLWLSFHPFSQEQYLNIVNHWLSRYDAKDTHPDEIRKQALQWALEHGSRSARCAWQFAKHWIGRERLNNDE